MSTYVLDASVAVAALRASDANHARAVSYLAPLLQGIDAIVVPAIFDVEVVATLTRAGYAPSDARRAADLFVGSARMVTLGPRAARAASRTASTTRLRTGDAIYVWVAEREALPLVTVDADILARAHLAGVTPVAP
ncbi:MAG TPA: PIN domain-containing protein [Gemmatimonadales bacterium]|nr:PIN domain-containing protein [Gemmatimonadales bacterium]